MRVYDDTVVAFVRKWESLCKNLLRDCGFEVRRNRFEFEGHYYPISIVVFEGKELGHFDSSYYQIGLNRRLIWQAKDVIVEEIIKHELAHYITHLRFGDVQSHGQQFRQVCADLRFPKEISAATLDLSGRNEIVSDSISERVLEKVKKLLQLSESGNLHEAELATLKANELLLRHNLRYQVSDAEPIYLDVVIRQTRKDAKLSAIYEILKHFIVRPVLSFGNKACCLEVSGSLTNVKMAKYVAQFLDAELDNLWRKSKIENGLRGLRAKNSFFYGVATGFDHKMQASKSHLSYVDRKSLVVIQRQLEARTHKIYKRLGQSSSTHRADRQANALGIQAGRRLSIRQGVETRNSNRMLTGEVV